MSLFKHTGISILGRKMQKAALVCFAILIFTVMTPSIKGLADDKTNTNGIESSCTDLQEKNKQNKSVLKISEIERAFHESNAAAMVVIKDGKVVISLGDTARRFKLHSVRKSLLSTLYGIYVAKGIINLNSKLESLRIEEKTPLFPSEKQARIIDLLKARSGIFLPAGAETPEMKEKRPKRLSKAPGTFWYYNNWDFNVLGTIFRQVTGRDIFEEFYNQIAIPLQMQDFRVIDGSYDYTESATSIHPSYPMKMSARDMARFGQLYLQKGEWNGKKILSPDWITGSFKSYSQVTGEGEGYDGYGYLWWTGVYAGNIRAHFASGTGGVFIGVFPSVNTVIVLCGNTYEGQFIHNRPELISTVLKNLTDGTNVWDGRKATAKNPKPDLKPIFLSSEEMKKYVGEYEGQYIDLYGLGDDTKHYFYIMEVGNDLILMNYDYYYKYRLLPLSKNRFFVEDLELYLTFDEDEKGNPANPVFHKTERMETLYNELTKNGLESSREVFNKIYTEIQSEFELKFFAHTLLDKGYNDYSLEALRWNVFRFPGSIDANREYINKYSENFSLEKMVDEYEGILNSVNSQGYDSGKVLWYLQWLKGRAKPIGLKTGEAEILTGVYGPRHIIERNGDLYHYRDDRPGKIEYKLLKAFDDAGNPVFILAGEKLDGFRLKFIMEEGKAIKLIGESVYGDISESKRSSN